MTLTKADVDNIEWGALRTKECATAGSANFVLMKSDELLALTAALREAVGLLRRYEAANEDGCGVCGEDWSKNGHAPDCALDAFLRRFA